MPESLAGIPPMVIGGSIISAVSLIFHIIGFSTTYWYKAQTPFGVVEHFGLWKWCGIIYEVTTCVNIAGTCIINFIFTF